MAVIKCKDCEYIFNDPCVLMNSLFEKKFILEQEGLLRIVPKQENPEINLLLINELGLKNYEELYRNFKQGKNNTNFRSSSRPIIFTLECILDHRNEYEVNCL